MVNRGAYVWGGILVFVGVLLFLGNLGILVIDVWKVLFPLVVILIGGMTVWAATRPRPTLAEQPLQLALENADRATVRVRFGAGHLQLRGGARAGSLVDGTFRGGVESSLRRSGTEAHGELRVPSDFFLHTLSPWMWWGGARLDWDVGLTESVPVSLDVETGASETVLDLSRLQVDQLRLACGASSVEIRMPSTTAMTKARIESGVASLVINVPDGVAASISVETGLANVRVNTGRFPKVDKIYRSPDYDSAARRLELRVEGGIASVDIN